MGRGGLSAIIQQASGATASLGGLPVNESFRCALARRTTPAAKLARRRRDAKPPVLFIKLLLLLLFSCASAWAQKDTGAIAGTVKDPSGAVVSGAKVRVTDIDLGTEIDILTNEVGEYTVSPLRVGRYKVAVEKTGFKTAIAGPVVVEVQERPSVNVMLQVGHADETVTVTTQSPLLETETSDLSQVVSGDRAVTLPLNGRNYAQLALLGAGVFPSEPGSRVETSYGFSSNGARAL